MGTFVITAPVDGVETNAQFLDMDAGPHDFTYLKNRRLQLHVKNDDVSVQEITVAAASETAVQIDGYLIVDNSAGDGFFCLGNGAVTIYTLSFRHRFWGTDGNTLTVAITASPGASLVEAWLVAGA